MNKDKIDLNAPAFGQGAQKLTDLEDKPETPAVVEEPKVEEEEVPAPEAVAEETPVPYSRFKKFHDEAKQLRDEVAALRQQVESVEPTAPTAELELPEFWKELYGDSEASQKAWKIQSEQNEALIQKARQEAIEAVRNERYEEAQQTEANIETIDSNLESLSDSLGRELTEKEQSAVLDIVDAYTPKDEDGNYAGPLLPFDKAWEIHELKTQAGKAPIQASKNNVASLSGSQTQGEPSINEKDSNFNPLDWGAWKKRL